LRGRKELARMETNALYYGDNLDIMAANVTWHVTVETMQ